MSIKKAWIQTFTNKKFHILQPRQEEICIEDIAHALAHQCRFNGHVKHFYSVAQHCVYASQIVPAEFALEALMHDASEAYICDMSRPLKHYTAAGAEYLKVEKIIELALAKKFGLPNEMSPQIKTADNLLLYAEKDALMPDMDWDTRWGLTEEAAKIKITEWSPRKAEKEYLKRFRKLYPLW